MELSKYIKKVKLNKLEAKEKFVITIGVFDGLHLGHSSIVDELVNNALLNGFNSGVITFENAFSQNLKKISSFLLTYDEKINLLSLKGVDYSIILPFSKEIKNLSSEDFIKVLLNTIPISCICVGSNFFFGKDRMGNINTLLSLGEKYNFNVKIVPLEKGNSDIISSSHIRNLLLNGEINMANDLLGYKYFINGVVEKGDNLGSKIGFPTVNVKYNKEKLIPKAGIYKGKVKIKKNIYNAAIYIGKRPTFHGKELRVEAYIIDFSDYLYGEEIEIALEDYIRPDQKFDSIEALKRQIQKDLQAIEDKIKKEENNIKIITIDGTAGSGKTTIAKFIAEKLKFDYIDSGALYRAVGLIIKEKNLSTEEEIIGFLYQNPIKFNFEDKIFRVYISDREITSMIRTEEIGKYASIVGRMPRVREFLTSYQREFLRKVKKGLVLEGRDSGTVVFPNANLKLFVNANIDIRAQRRARDLSERDIERIKKYIIERDKQDMNRDIAPLRFPNHGYFIDNSESPLEEIYDKIISLYLKAL
ncbi:MAG: bifunctional riboflavin kinase/FAD synthetase [Dictyoglomus turgidum]|uniref:bifunctional riboflavin kinase/FAD synthetase n=1 Tax=Dictyoglomus turgidum TaxID=513050 RepID=UPI003C716744